MITYCHLINHIDFPRCGFRLPSCGSIHKVDVGFFIFKKGLNKNKSKSCDSYVKIKYYKRDEIERFREKGEVFDWWCYKNSRMGVIINSKNSLPDLDVKEGIISVKILKHKDDILNLLQTVDLMRYTRKGMLVNYLTIDIIKDIIIENGFLDKSYQKGFDF